MAKSNNSESKIKPVVRKALIAANPDYYSLTLDAQEIFRATKPASITDKIYQVFLNELFSVDCTIEEASNHIREMSIAKLDLLNQAKIYVDGIGKDYIFLNESFAENTSLLDFKTLFDYDYNDYLFQNSVNSKEIPDYEEPPYYAFRFPRWARLLISDQLYYANLTSLATHVLDLVTLSGNEEIDKLIPHDYEPAEDHGERVKEGFVWNRKLNANGLEPQLEELRHRWHGYQSATWLRLGQEFLRLPAFVIMTEPTDEFIPKDEYHLDFIFSNEKALKTVNFKSFLDDCEKIEKHRSFITEYVHRQTTATIEFLNENYKDILDNFDPSIVPFRKKYKLIMSDQALDDISKIDGNTDIE